MIVFFGIMLQMSIESHNLGRYHSYFYEFPAFLLGLGVTEEMNEYNPWAQNYMLEHQFK